MKKTKEPIEPNNLYKMIVKELIAHKIDPNQLNVKETLKNLSFTTEYYMNDIITFEDVTYAVEKIEHPFTALAFALVSKNAKEIKNVEKYLKSINKEEEI